MNISTTITGFDALMAKFHKAREKAQAARDYALASTGKMVREYAKDAGRTRGESAGGNPLGWPNLSPFTGTISNQKGARRAAFVWAAKTVDTMKAGPAWKAWFGSERTERFALSRRDAQALKRRIRLASGGKTRKKKTVKLSTRYNPMEKLRHFVRSAICAAAGATESSVTIGFFRSVGLTSPDREIESLVEKQARGYTVSVTERMRRFFFAIGFPTGATSFQIPPRPWFAPVFAALRARIPEHFREKFLSRMMPALPGSNGQ